MSQSKGTQTAEGVRIDVPLTHRELAGIAGVSRETATRVIRHLVQAKLLVTQGKSFVIPDPAELLETPLLE
jgi:CRP-like cAMP-binding protein